MNLKYSPDYEDIVFATRFLDLELEYTKIEKGLELESDGNILTVIKEILLLLKSKDTSIFLTDNCVSKIIKRKLSPSNFNIKMLENIDKENLKFYDAMLFASAYKFFIEGKHVQPTFLDLFTQIQEKFYEKRQFVKFEPLKFAGEIRVGLITEIVSADNSDKLYVEQVSFGREKQIVSGLKDKFKPEDLLNKSFLFLTNIKPKKVGGNLSEGMILCAKSDNDFEILDGTDFCPGSILHYNDGFQVVQTYTVPNLDLQSEKGKTFMGSLSVKDGVLYFKDCAFYCEGQKFYTKIVKNGTIS